MTDWDRSRLSGRTSGVRSDGGRGDSAALSDRFRAVFGRELWGVGDDIVGWRVAAHERSRRLSLEADTNAGSDLSSRCRVARAVGGQVPRLAAPRAFYTGARLN